MSDEYSENLPWILLAESRANAELYTACEYIHKLDIEGGTLIKIVKRWIDNGHHEQTHFVFNPTHQMSNRTRGAG